MNEEETFAGCNAARLRIVYMAMSLPTEPQPATSRFPTTAWSMVVKAGNPQTQFFHESLARLCNSYWFPVYVFIRNKGFSSDEARDCTQEFFARLIEKQYLAGLDQSKGRFRSFVLSSVSHFICNRLDAQRALARQPRDASPVRLRNRDAVDGRPRGHLRKFGLSRVRMRELAHEGQLPGIRKASW